MDHKECPGRKTYQCAIQARIAKSKDFYGSSFFVFKMDGPEKKCYIETSILLSYLLWSFRFCCKSISTGCNSVIANKMLNTSDFEG